MGGGGGGGAPAFCGGGGGAGARFIILPPRPVTVKSNEYIKTKCKQILTKNISLKQKTKRINKF